MMLTASSAGTRTVLARLRVVVLTAAMVALLSLPAACGGGAASPPSAPSSIAAPTPQAAAPSAAVPSSLTDPATTSSLSGQFPDPAGPLDLRVTRAGHWDGVPVRYVTFRSAGAVVTGVLSVPRGAGPFPAVLYAPGVSCRAGMFEYDVAALQRAGLAALVIDPPDGRDPHVVPVSLDPRAAADAHVRYVTDLRRGIDVLRSLPEVDRSRLGYVGYSWGGFVGGYLAGLRLPIRAYVLTYAGADWVGADPTEVAGFVDPAAALAAGRGGAYLLQAGRDDRLFSRGSVERYFDAAPEPKRLDWFPGGHGDLWAVPAGAAAESHRAWLEKIL